MITSLVHLTAEPGEQVLIYRQGRFVRALSPGARHRVRRGERHVVVSTRQRMVELIGQEIATADGLQVRVSAAVRWEVAEARAFHEVDEHPAGVLHVAAQIAVREVIASLESAELVSRLRAEPDLTRQMVERTQAGVAPLGIRVVTVLVKDVQLPPEVRRAAVELVTAKARGQAQLEEARARTAALRTLANGAALLDDHPALAQLQMVQAVPAGAQVVLKVGTDESASD